jgi:hypothetical protein
MARRIIPGSSVRLFIMQPFYFVGRGQCSARRIQARTVGEYLRALATPSDTYVAAAQGVKLFHRRAREYDCYPRSRMQTGSPS